MLFKRMEGSIVQPNRFTFDSFFTAYDSLKQVGNWISNSWKLKVFTMKRRIHRFFGLNWRSKEDQRSKGAQGKPLHKESIWHNVWKRCHLMERMVAGCIKCGSIHNACELFNKMPLRNDVSCGSPKCKIFTQLICCQGFRNFQPNIDGMCRTRLGNRCQYFPVLCQNGSFGTKQRHPSNIN